MSTVPRPSRYEFSKVSADFESDGTRCAGWLYRPDRPTDPPAVVMAADVGAERTFLRSLAETYAVRGFAVFLFDYRTVGASDGDPRGYYRGAGGVADWDAAVARVRSLSDLGPVVLRGTGLAGGHALALAAEERVAAVVAGSPWLDGRAVLRRRPAAALARALAAGVRDRLGSPVGRPHRVPAVADPTDGDAAVVVGDGLVGAYRAAAPRAARWENEAAARSVLSLARFRPGGRVDEVAAPALLVAASDDPLVPDEAVAAAADRARRATFLRLPSGDPVAPRALGHELAFLDDALGSAR